MKRPVAIAFAVLSMLGLTASSNAQTIASRTFTYQGRLTDNGAPANGQYDLQFQLFNLPVGGAAIGPTISLDNFNVVNGLFQANLDFGNNFTGNEMYVQVGVRPGPSVAAHTLLTPRRAALAAPYSQSLVPGAIVNGTTDISLTLGTQTGANALFVTSANPGEEAAAIYAENTATSGATIGILAASFSDEDDAAGVYGVAEGIGANFGVRGVTISTALGAAGVYGRAQQDTGEIYGVSGESRSGTANSAGVFGLVGRNDGTVLGVHGLTESTTNDTVGVRGEANSTTGRTIGVHGLVVSTTASSSGVFGDNTAATGTGYGVRGRSNSATLGSAGVRAEANGGAGINASSSTGVGALITASLGNIIEGYGAAGAGNVRFRVSNTGNVTADGTFTSPAADFAEWMPAGEAGLEPGDVLAIGPDGRLVRSTTAHQTNVAGVVSTKPAFLGGDGVHDGEDNKVQLAVVGIVPVKVISENGPIAAGDLLVASSSAGHAMKAGVDPANGSVIGKALQDFNGDAGTISMLVVLQ